MKSAKKIFLNSGAMIWLPAACLVGFVIGSWGANEELNAYRQSVKEWKKDASNKASGFDTFASMVKIPEMARRPRRQKKSNSGKKQGVAGKAGPDGSAATNPAPGVDAPANEAVKSAPVAQRRPGFAPDDLRTRIEEAQDLWRTRVDVVSAQWKERLKLSGESEKAFDAALQEMNERLYDSVAAVAALVSESESMTPESGLRLVGETTAIMAEAYDRIGECVPQNMRDEVSQMQIVDFIDPGVAEPLIGVQGKLESLGRMGGRR